MNENEFDAKIKEFKETLNKQGGQIIGNIVDGKVGVAMINNHLTIIEILRDMNRDLEALKTCGGHQARLANGLKGHSPEILIVHGFQRGQSGSHTQIFSRCFV